jgi:hypothetical protein
MRINGLARLWAVAALLALAACAAKSADTKAWQEFRVPDTDFAVSVPGAPHTDKDVTAKDGNVERSYHVELGTAAYMIGYTTYAGDAKKPMPLDGWLDDLRKAFASKMKAKLRTEGRVSLGDSRAMEFVFDIPRSDGDGPYTMRGRFYVRHVGSGKNMKDVLYQTFVVDNPGHEMDASVTRFIDSFHFVGG